MYTELASKRQRIKLTAEVGGGCVRVVPRWAVARCAVSLSPVTLIQWPGLADF